MAFYERGPEWLAQFNMGERSFQGKVKREDFLSALDRRLKENGYIQSPDSPWLRYGFDQAYKAPEPHNDFFTGVEALVKAEEPNEGRLSAIICPVTIRAWPMGVLISGLVLFAILWFIGIYLIYGEPSNWPNIMTVPLWVGIAIFILLFIPYFIKIIRAKNDVWDAMQSFVDELAKDLGLTPLRKWSGVQLLKKDAIKQWVLGRRVGKFPYRTVTDSEAVRHSLINPILSAIRLKKEGKVTRAKWSYVFGVLQATVDLIFIAALLFATRRFFYNIAYLISLPILVRFSTLYFTTRITLYKCTKCDQIVLETAKTCPKCGTQL